MVEQIALPKAKATRRSGNLAFVPGAGSVTTVTVGSSESPKVDEQQEIEASLRVFMEGLVNLDSEFWVQEEALENFRNWLMSLPSQRFQEAVHQELVTANYFVKGKASIGYESNDGSWEAVHLPTGFRGSAKDKYKARSGLEDEILKHLEPWRKLPDLIGTVDQIKGEIVEKAYSTYYS